MRPKSPRRFRVRPSVCRCNEPNDELRCHLHLRCFFRSLNEAVEKLQREDTASAELVKLRFFAGLKQGEAAAALGLPRRTADRYWSFARAWLYEELRRGEDD